MMQISNVKENSFLLDTCKHINNSTSHIEIDQKFGLCHFTGTGIITVS